MYPSVSLAVIITTIDVTMHQCQYRADSEKSLHSSQTVLCYCAFLIKHSNKDSLAECPVGGISTIIESTPLNHCLTFNSRVNFMLTALE